MIKRYVDRVFADARARLIYRSLLAGGVVLYAADEPFTKAAVVSAAWAAVEAFTPLNALVGWFKQP